jgi:hypothetical protein
MAKTTRTPEELWFLVNASLADCCARWPQLSQATLKGKRAYWRQKLKLKVHRGNMENIKNLKYQDPERDDHPETKPNPNAKLAHDLLSSPSQVLDNLAEIYGSQKNRVAEVELSFDKPSVNVLHLNELLLGHQHSDYGFFKQVVEQVDKIKPDLIIMSGIVQGDFPNIGKRRRNTLVPALANMSSQFHYGSQILEMLTATGTEVIYNLSNDDRRIAEENTVAYFSRMLNLANQQEPKYHQIDQMKAHPKWQEHLNFNIDHVFPYCLRAGRTLKGAEQIAAESDQTLEIDEYMMLFDTIKRLERGDDPNPDYAPYLDLEHLGDGKYKITDNVNLTLNTQAKSHKDWIRHSFGFSDEPMYGNHMSKPMSIIGARMANGEPVPKMLLLQHNLEEVGVGMGETWIVSSGGLIKTGEWNNTKGSKADAPGDVSRRANTTRARVHQPSASAHERADDGRHIVTIYNEALMSKAESCERTSLVLLTDWQIGSLTARPDLLVKYMDYALGSSEKKNLYFNGDFIQGRNYPNFPNENQMLGLISIESQIEFTRNLMAQSITSNKDIMKAFVTVGNHEWNSGTIKWHGDSFTRYLRDLLKERDIPTSFNEGLVTQHGDNLRTYAAIDYVGDYGVYVTHQPMFKGAKGNSGGLPVYQFQSHDAGVGGIKQSIDIQMAGHWHHPQYLVAGNKLCVISGSMAGLSGYEWERGYHPVISGVITHVGGGLPPQLEFLSHQMLCDHEIKTGPFSAEALAAAGYSDDEGHDPMQHGIHMPRKYPKSALQKYILDMVRDASEGEHGVLR